MKINENYPIEPQMRISMKLTDQVFQFFSYELSQGAIGINHVWALSVEKYFDLKMCLNGLFGSFFLKVKSCKLCINK